MYVLSVDKFRILNPDDLVAVPRTLIRRFKVSFLGYRLSLDLHAYDTGHKFTSTVTDMYWRPANRAIPFILFELDVQKCWKYVIIIWLTVEVWLSKWPCINSICYNHNFTIHLSIMMCHPFLLSLQLWKVYNVFYIADI